jgi:SHS2 domain-containing protein
MTETEGTYRFLDHTADVQVECRASTLDGLFAAAARSLYEIALQSVHDQKDESCEIELLTEGMPDEEILIAWLQELLYLLDTRHFVAVTFDFGTRGGDRICVSLRGYRHDPHERATEIKAATYHDLSLEKQDGVYIALVIFDL